MRCCFFSFHYQHDIFRANVVRNSHVCEGSAAAGFIDGSLWEEAKKKGDAVVKRMIDDALVGTSVTVVLIGTYTSQRRFVHYEIEKSIERGNGLLGIRIHNIKDPRTGTALPGLTPQLLIDHRAPVYDWNSGLFGGWVEEAYRQAEMRQLAGASRARIDF